MDTDTFQTNPDLNSFKLSTMYRHTFLNAAKVKKIWVLLDMDTLLPIFDTSLTLHAFNQLVTQQTNNITITLANITSPLPK